MSRPIPRWMALTAMLWLACTGIASAADAKPSPEAARLDSYVSPDGQSYFALSLSPTVTAPRVTGHDLVVLFDTSASQAGEFRQAFESFQKARVDVVGITGGPQKKCDRFAPMCRQRVAV